MASGELGGSQNVHTDRSWKLLSCTSTLTRFRTESLLPRLNCASSGALATSGMPVCCSATA